MNTYTITATREDGTTFSDRVTAPTPGAARKDFKDIYRHGKPYTITSVDVYKENVSASKDQERKAVEQIRAIIATLGPDSYTATALEGCLEDAESNIENDFWDSYKTRFENALNEIERLKEKLASSVKDYKAAHEAAHQIAAEKDAVISSLQAQVEALQKRVLSEDDLTDAIQLVKDREAEGEEAMKQAAGEIVKYADDSTSEEFTAAVRLHRTYAKWAEYYKALRLRFEAAQNATAGAQ